MKPVTPNEIQGIEIVLPKRSYFEGWYFKHQKGKNTLALIVGFSTEGTGEPSAFVQVVTNDCSYNIPYPISQFHGHRERPGSPESLRLFVGRSLFSGKGLDLYLDGPGISVKGSLLFGRLHPPASDIMGPFRFVPRMECNHGILSMYHSLSGEIQVNGERFDFNGGTGYIEKDWGHSFPENYLWAQCNTFEQEAAKNEKTNIIAAVARIPFAGTHFTGCICSVFHKGHEYRLATYKGVRILEFSESSLILKQGHLKLELKLISRQPQKLLAPARGRMTRTVHEHTACTVAFRFSNKGEVLFDWSSPSASFEYV